MPTVKPFHGIRYSSPDELAQVVCPPYDIITPEEQAALHYQHPHNAVRLELARSPEGEADRYQGVGETFQRWMDEGVLVKEPSESFYVYRQDFRTTSGALRRVAGVIGALTLEEFGPESGVLPHERTMEGPKADRLALMRACPVNISPIYGLYRGGSGLRPYLDSLENRLPTARLADRSGTLHRLWVVSAPGEVEMLGDALSASPLVIADGHHRYETALEFHREKGGDPGEHASMMCFCVDADAEDLVVLPYNRALRSPRAKNELEKALERRGAERLNEDQARYALRNDHADHPFVFVLPHSWHMTTVSDAEVVDTVGDRPLGWRTLDVVALHEVLLPKLLPEGVSELSFSKDPDEIVRSVHEEGWDAGVLLRALSAVDVVEAARTGERMPQKASYFWPKAITGLVFRSLE